MLTTQELISYHQAQQLSPELEKDPHAYQVSIDTVTYLQAYEQVHRALVLLSGKLPGLEPA